MLCDPQSWCMWFPAYMNLLAKLIQQWPRVTQIEEPSYTSVECWIIAEFWLVKPTSSLLVWRDICVYIWRDICVYMYGETYVYIYIPVSSYHAFVICQTRKTNTTTKFTSITFFYQISAWSSRDFSHKIMWCIKYLCWFKSEVTPAALPRIWHKIIFERRWSCKDLWATVINSCERTDKITNWTRPTTPKSCSVLRVFFLNNLEKLHVLGSWRLLMELWCKL